MKLTQQEQQWLKKMYEKCESAEVSKLVIKQFEAYYENLKRGIK